MCEHDVRLRSRGQPFTDSNIILVGVQFYCDLCGVTFKSVGVAAGVNHSAPGTTDEGEVTVFPVCPADEEPITVRAH